MDACCKLTSWVVKRFPYKLQARWLIYRSAVLQFLDKMTVMRTLETGSINGTVCCPSVWKCNWVSLYSLWKELNIWVLAIIGKYSTMERSNEMDLVFTRQSWLFHYDSKCFIPPTPRKKERNNKKKGILLHYQDLANSFVLTTFLWQKTYSFGSDCWHWRLLL